MNFLSLIEAKRDGRALTEAEVQEFVAEYTNGHLPDYQVSAFLMAAYFRGFDAAETRALTLAMRGSGQVLELPRDPRPVVDKHSTGGVGDKVSLPLAPLLACLGFRVPMISGRGLGITGGTLDKLDSIPGFQTLLSAGRIRRLVQRVGCVICGQTENMVPADKAMYALRDVTGTVPSIPLIVASILSKKLAEGLSALVLDVKFGAAAFMPTLQRARELATAIVKLGGDCGVKTRALLTDMNTPLGRAAGNWLEVKEAVACLEGGTDGLGRRAEDLRELVLACAAHLLVQAGRAKSLAAGHRQARACLDSGQPRRKWEQMLLGQGTDLGAFNRRLTPDHTAPVVLELKAPRAGYVTRCGARLIGEVVRELGGGRLTKESVINHDVGVDRLAKPGERVAAGETLARIHAADSSSGEEACERIASAFVVSPRPPAETPLIAGWIKG